MQTDSIERNVKRCEQDLDSTGAGTVQQGERWTLHIVMMFHTQRGVGWPSERLSASEVLRCVEFLKVTVE